MIRNEAPGKCKMQNVQCKMQNRVSPFNIFHFSFFILQCLIFVTTGAISTRAAGAEPELLDGQLLDQGWIELFDGDTLYGWTPTGDAEWEAAGGEIRTAGDKPGFLMSTTRWADYVLHVEFKTSDDNTNSGIFLRTPLEPKNPARDCYELNIAPQDNPFPTASLVGRQKATLADEKFPAADEWHVFEVTAEGDKITVVLDGERVFEYGDASPVRIGHIGLQSREGGVAFRNLRLRPLGLQPLFNGRNLEGWSAERAEQSQFKVTGEGELQVLNGPGQVETEAELANFVLQLECKINGEGLNSGIFFRTLREGRWAGYESQLNNVFRDGDRTRPADFGTGGIYRRQPARRVVADDHEWFTKTIVVDGPHMAVWVNGYQVSDWTDDRPPSENAREGFREAAGVIAIQGHDPSTNLLFRNIRAVELPR
jgi:Domain of Unknown Function (DUF1080)